jgi:hypothetical protein
MRLNLLSSLVFASFLFSCSQRRDEQFAQGQGQDLHKVSEYHDQWFKLKTKDIIGASSTTAALSSDVKAPEYSFYNFSMVAYETNAKLLGDVVFRGKPNTEYSLLYRLEDNFLKIYKVASKDLIPTDEHPYAESIDSLPEGNIAVPLVAYPVKGYFKVENVKNSYNEKSHILIESSRTGFQSDGFVKVDFLSRQIFRPEEYKDIFPASFFKGKWFYVNSVVKTKDVSEDMNFHDGERLVASRVEFFNDQEKLLSAKSTEVPGILKSNSFNFETLVRIPSRWIDPEAEPVGRFRGMRGAQKNKLLWKDKPYVALDLAELSSLDEVEKELGTRKFLSDVTVQDDFLGVTLSYPDSGRKITHAFMRVDKRLPYKPRSLSNADSYLFGYFPAGISPEQFQMRWRDRDNERHQLMSRFNPEKKQLKVYFPVGTPDRFKDWGREIVKSWSDGFEAIGKPNWLVLDESKEVQLGDPRYDIVLNFIWSESDHKTPGLLGYGPGFTDNVTGEIIGGTANIFASQVFHSLVGDIRSYIIRKSKTEVEANASKWFDPVSKVVSVAEGSRKDFFASLGNRFEALESSSLHGFAMNNVGLNRLGVESALLANQSVTKGALISSSVEAQFFPEVVKGFLPERKTPKNLFNLKCESATSMTATLQDIEKLCPEIVEYTLKLREGSGPREDEADFIKACANRLLPSNIVAVGVHEVGHVLGLMHNFKASSDKANFYTKFETRTSEQVESSSVMDYLTSGEKGLLRVGKYDIAALRFGYMNQVETASGAIENLKVGKSIAESVPEYKKFSYCNEYDIHFGNDPLCDRFDKGSTLKEIVDHAISTYFLNLSMTQRRYDRSRFIPQSSFAYRLMGLEKLLSIYGEYRYVLQKDVLKRSPYFQGISPENYLDKFIKPLNEAIDAEKRVSNGYSRLEDLRRAALTIEAFLYELAFLPDHYCKIISSNKNVPLELIPFSQLREEVRAEYGINVESCRSSAVEAYLSASNRQVASGPYGDFGFDVKSYRYHTNDEMRPQLEALYDVAGTEFDRQIAFIAMSVRATSSMKSLQKRFFPVILDDPMVRKNLQLKLWSRVILGLNSEGLPPNLSDFENKNSPSATSNANAKLMKALGKAEVKSNQKKDPFESEAPDNDILKLVLSYEKSRKVLYKEFDNESVILNTAMSSLLRGYMVPGSTQETLNRVTETRVYHTKDQETIQAIQKNDDMVSVPFQALGTLAYSSFTENPFGAALLYSYKKALQQQQLSQMKTADLRKALFESLENSNKEGLNILSIMDSINGINKILSMTRRFVSPELNEELMTFMKEISKKVDPVQKAMGELEKSTKRGALSVSSGEKVLSMSVDESEDKLGEEEKALLKAGRDLSDYLKSFSSLEPKFDTYFSNFERFLGASDHFRGEMNKQIDLMMNLVIGPSAID